jgi:hypothetical protein
VRLEDDDDDDDDEEEEEEEDASVQYRVQQRCSFSGVDDQTDKISGQDQRMKP